MWRWCSPVVWPVGGVACRNFLLVQKRLLILTDRPRLLYFETARWTLRGEIPWSTERRPVVQVGFACR
jgi:hypothetical protein